MITDIKGDEFQDFLERKLKIPVYHNKIDQLKGKESISPLGFEMKYNEKAQDIGVWIEIAEKRNKNNDSWIMSKWIHSKYIFFIIAGNQNIFWIFDKKTLLLLAIQKDWKEIKGQTSIGFNLKINDCNRYCIWKYENNVIKILNIPLRDEVIEIAKSRINNIKIL